MVLAKAENSRPVIYRSRIYGSDRSSQESNFLHQFLKELGYRILADVTLFNDNQSAEKLAKNAVFHSRSKHIDIRYHFIRQAIQDHPINLEYLRTEDMSADVLTKLLSVAKHEKCIAELGLINLF